MYILYLDWLKDNNSNIEPVTNHYYRDVFNEFNIGFEPPRSDTCNYCDQVNNEIRALNVATESADINRLQGEKQHHLAVSKEVHHILKACKTIEDPSVGAIAFDLQQTLPTPKLTTGVQYYKRKLWTYNFGVHNIKTGRSVMYLWNEADGKRGSAEITSCVLHYINNSVDINIKTLKMFSDNCGGQNKNINMVLTCLRKIHEGRFDKIEHFFMVPGHSYLPCDRDFGNIESKVRGIEVFSQPNYADIIKACRKTRPFKVVNMPRNLFLDVEVLQTSITNRTKTGCSFSHGRVFIYDAKYKQGFGIKASYHQAEPLYVKLQKGRKNLYDINVFDLATRDLPEKYPTPIKLNVKKLNDIQVLLKYIPPHHKEFMEDLIMVQQGLTNVVYVDDHDPDDDVIDYC